MFSKECEEKIIGTFENRMNLFSKVGRQIKKEISSVDGDEQILLKYLYSVMPNSDIGDYSLNSFLDFAEQGSYLWKHSPYVNRTMEDFFLQYVVLHRVNNEEIRPCRRFFYNEIKDRIKGLDEQSSIIEINYWCAEHATYKASDERTLSALAVYESGYGRCGEESVFLVNALRSCGFVARQIYAPRWSHCDDNHAWVEVYVNGKWQFMGACEPEEVLNKGWFISASSRAMAIQSKYFGETMNMSPEMEEVIHTDGIVTMYNQLNRYAYTAKLSITVMDRCDRPVEHVRIEGQIINYSEIVTVLNVYTDENGMAECRVGFGDIILTITKEKFRTEELVKISEIKESVISLTIKTDREQALPNEFDLIAPSDAPLYTGTITDMQKKIGNQRRKQVDIIRKRIHKDDQNYDIIQFLSEEENHEEREKFIDHLSEKDRRDIGRNILEGEFRYALSTFKILDKDINYQKRWIQYVLNQRIQNEQLSCYRQFITSYFDDVTKQSFMTDPKKIWKWIIKNIKSSTCNEYSSLITAPKGVLSMKRGTLLSCKILFVAICRSFGIPARLRKTDEVPEYWDNIKFVSAFWEKEFCGILTLQMADKNIKWIYKENYSISRLCGNEYQTVNMSDEFIVSRENVISCKLLVGRYRLLTSNRLPNGNIFAKLKDFEIVAGKTTELKLELRHADLADMLENITLQPFTLYKKDGSSCDAGELMHGKKKTFFFLEESKEPTEHILNELMERKQEFYKIQEQLIFVLRNIEALKDPNLSRVLREMPDIQIYYDDFSELINKLGRAIYVDPDKLPLIMVTDGRYNSIYGTSGYNVGTADMLYRIMQ